ncbi:MFS general substrate transporter [Aspergillus germanicus]
MEIEIANVVGLQPTDEENAKLLRKIDMVLMPVMCVCYMLQLLDKLTLNFSSQLGLIQDLDLHGSQYSWSSSIFYFGYLIWTWPSSWLVIKLPLGKYITGTVLIWGVVLMCHGACNNFGELMAARFFLGASEAAIAPGFSLIVSMFYTRDEQPLRQGLWYAGNCIANIFGGLLCFGIGHIQSSLATWRVLFLILGGVTVAYSTVLWAFLPDSPSKAQFLNDRERKLAVHRTLSNTSSALDEDYFQTYQMWEALKDPQAWILALYTFSINICNGGITTFNSLLIQGFGFSEFQTLLLQMPLGGCQLAVLAIMSIMASLFKMSRVFLMACTCAISLVGMVLVYALHQTDAYGRLGGTYLAAVFAATTPISLSLIASNVGGFTKKSTVNAMLFLAYSLGNIVGPQLYLSSQAPIYITGVRSTIAGFCFGIMFLVMLLLYYFLENRRRAMRSSPEGEMGAEERLGICLNKTDKENPRFRYIL